MRLLWKKKSVPLCHFFSVGWFVSHSSSAFWFLSYFFVLAFSMHLSSNEGGGGALRRGMVESNWTHEWNLERCQSSLGPIFVEWRHRSTGDWALSLVLTLPLKNGLRSISLISVSIKVWSLAEQTKSSVDFSTILWRCRHYSIGTSAGVCGSVFFG